MNLWTDLSKNEKTQLIKDCKKLIDEFDPAEDGNNESIFKEIDSHEAVKEF